MSDLWEDLFGPDPGMQIAGSTVSLVFVYIVLIAFCVSIATCGG